MHNNSRNQVLGLNMQGLAKNKSFSLQICMQNLVFSWSYQHSQASSSFPIGGGFIDRSRVKYSFKDDKVEALFKMLSKSNQLKLPEPRNPEDVRPMILATAYTTGGWAIKPRTAGL